jgi:hypothetical protein
MKVNINGTEYDARVQEGPGGPLNLQTGFGEVKVPAGAVIVDLGDGFSAVLPAYVCTDQLKPALVVEEAKEPTRAKVADPVKPTAASSTPPSTGTGVSSGVAPKTT